MNVSLALRGVIFRAALVTLAGALCSAPLLAAEINIGVDMFGGNVLHRETGENASATTLAPLLTFDVRERALQIVAEGLPPVTVSHSSVTSGLESTNIAYDYGTLRYCVCSGEMGLRSRRNGVEPEIEILRNTIAPVEFDSSRGAGPRYELVNSIPIAKGSVQISLATNPRMHAQLSSTFEPPDIYAPRVSEQESQVDAAISYVRQVAPRWRIEEGIRYINMSARYDSGAFADGNRALGVFAKFTFRLTTP